MADGIVRIVINAVDKYSGVLTGLNQGLELAGKAFKAISFSADVAGKAITASLDLAGKGGAYQEIRDQLDNVARSFDVNADRVVADIDRITLNMTRLPDAAKLAGRGIALGLNEDQLEKFFTFIKRRTELTGEDFKSLSETVFTALASGRGKSVFASFGIAMQAGESMDSLIKKLEVATGAYGKTSFNTADNLLALATQQENFTTKIGQAINKTPAFQRILAGITETAVEFVKSFNPQDLVSFFDFLISSAEKAVRYVRSSFPAVAELIDNAFVEGRSSGERFSKGVINAFFLIYRSVGEVFNGIADIIQNTGLGDFANTIGAAANNVVQIFAYVGDAVARTVTGIADLVIDNVRRTIDGFRFLLSTSDTLSAALGVSATDVELVDQQLAKLKRSVSDAAENFSRSLEGVSGAGENLFAVDVNAGVEKWRVNLAEVNAEQNRILATVGKTADEINGIALSKDAFKIKPEIEAESADRAKKDAEALRRQIENAAKIKVEAFGEGELAALIDKLFALEQRRETISVDVNSAELAGVDREIEAIRKKLNFKLTLTEDIKAQGFLTQIKEYLAAVNWPAELQSLGEFLLSFILLKARGERLPLAITTSTG